MNDVAPQMYSTDGGLLGTVTPEIGGQGGRPFGRRTRKRVRDFVVVPGYAAVDHPERTERVAPLRYRPNQQFPVRAVIVDWISVDAKPRNVKMRLKSLFIST